MASSISIQLTKTPMFLISEIDFLVDAIQLQCHASYAIGYQRRWVYQNPWNAPDISGEGRAAHQVHWQVEGGYGGR